MQLSEKWIREYIDTPLSVIALVERLNMAGIAVESCTTTDDNDHILTFELTPNRGDCLSVLGIAREIQALTGVSLQLPAQMFSTQKKESPDIVFPIINNAADVCPIYYGVVVRGIAQGVVPKYIRERLEKSGVKIIHPVVDILNYVMLELGQPLHAFDYQKLQQHIEIRYAHEGESLALLDGNTVILNTNTLVIADAQGAQAIAGIMGGLASAVSAQTQEIFIESAHFIPEVIAGRARQYGLHTDASHRFERGVDPLLPEKALKRVLQLLKTLYPDSQQGEIFSSTPVQAISERKLIRLRHAQIEKLAGVSIKMDSVAELLQKAGMQVEVRREGYWQVIPPSYRFDIALEQDLIEEILRLQGYHTITANFPLGVALSASETHLPLSRLQQYFMDHGLHEIISYSFIDPQWQQWCDPDAPVWQLSNPLASTMSCMRTSLWPGLLQAVQYNLNRQQESVHLFETGLRFRPQAKVVTQQQEAVLAGVMAGWMQPEQWGLTRRPVDFFDAKQLLENLQQLMGKSAIWQWQSASHPALHPGQSARIEQDGEAIGWCGMLHPSLQQKCDIPVPVVLFEIRLSALQQIQLPVFQSLSKFPFMRRDLSLLLDQSITADTLQQTIRNLQPADLIEIKIFDLYQGKNIPPGKKSVALALIFQAQTRTLLEAEVDQSTQQIIEGLNIHLGAMLRE